MTLPPSGRQVALSNGKATAVVTEVGASLRAFEIGGEPVLFGYGADELCSAGRGQVLAPWPNRLEDGSYEFDGTPAEAGLDEPERHNAIHGLVRWMPFEISVTTGTRAELVTVLCPQPGYPWRLRLAIAYELVSPEQLSVRATAVNESGATAPFGIGFHPYVAAGAGGLDGAQLQLAASTRLLLDDRALPVGAEAVAGTGYDFAPGRSLAGVRLDDCFTGLSSPWSAEIVRADGRRVVVSGGEGLGYVMCFTGDTLAPESARRAIAIEPMSCAPNALRTGEGLVRLEPGGAWEAAWSITAAGW